MTDPDRSPGFFVRLGRSFNLLRIILLNVVFFGLLILLLLWIFSAEPTPRVPAKAALVLNPKGAIVEVRSPVDPIQRWLAPSAVLAESLLQNILDAIDHARKDDRIDMLVLDLDDLESVSIVHANVIGKAIDKFRQSGKQVVAYGRGYDQQPYLIASFANAVYMHPMGQVMLPGYTLNQIYFKGLIDKLKVNIHVFREGKYKEFVEPYIRSDMSDAAREANRAVVTALWHDYGKEVMANRGIDVSHFQRYTNSYPEAAKETGGDFARLAVEYHLVDELLTPDEARARIADTVGHDRHGNFSGIGYRDYLRAVDGPTHPTNPPLVAVITGEGPVVMGNQLRGVIAADQMVQEIRRVRDDGRVGALVVRLNTPGGSALAAELIRQELELTQLAGKPVVISMGPLAASGGYWISSTADAIVAEPTTLTGSIGVFGLVPTFEDTLRSIGITSDGVQTTPLSPVSPLTGMSEATARTLEIGTEQAYRHFLDLVARGRDLSLDQVEKIAQGRVWVGSQALDLGLVDELGGEQAAITRAAKLAHLKKYGVRRIQPPLTPEEVLLREIFGLSSVSVGRWLTSTTGLSPVAALPPVVRQARDAWQALTTLNDPRHNYALCLSCSLEP